ncbi:MAG: hypothetical protein KF825_05965 [Ferruginibacter sp.]|nr:hypothetical protein [Ferruginibacter sp.]
MQPQYTKSIYSNVVDHSKPNQYEYSIEVYHNALTNFAKATEEEKNIKLFSFLYEKSGEYVYKDTFQYLLPIASITKDSKDANTYIIKTKSALREFGKLEWPKELAANPTFKIKINESAVLLDKTGKTFTTMKLKTVDDDEECFITTACVTEKGLADNCDELTTLRSLRENYMRQTPQGETLLAEYQTLGPAVVAAISHCENRKEIYDYLYQNMITPSVAMIKNGEYQDAVDWYQGFSKELKMKYC